MAKFDGEFEMAYFSLKTGDKKLGFIRKPN
jgi:hypothetical protein